MNDPSTSVTSSHRLEVACFTLTSALTAIASGAHRIELCDGPASTGGLTPSIADLQIVKDAAGFITVHVMIRPRGGGFVYTEGEVEVMKASIAELRDLADGFVFGALDRNGAVHRRHCEELLEAVRVEKPCIFHRAVDETANFKQSLDTIRRLGFAGVLTSGTRSTAIEGADAIGEAVSTHGDGLQIIAGGGVRASNLAELVVGTKTIWYHSSALINGGAVADAKEIRNMINILEEAPNTP
jgi:copper homeostasis protein